jgi:hypothetical protein
MSGITRPWREYEPSSHLEEIVALGDFHEGLGTFGLEIPEIKAHMSIDAFSKAFPMRVNQK